MWSSGPARRTPEAGRPRAGRLGFVLKPGMRVGLFGGSFDPPHEGHAHVARTARNRLGLDRVIWLVSPQNPLKRARPQDLAQRLAAVRRLARSPADIVSDAETRLGVRYTIDLIRILKARYPGVKFVWVMGGDSLAGFTSGAAGPRSCAWSRWWWWPGPARPCPTACRRPPAASTTPACRRCWPAACLWPSRRPGSTCRPRCATPRRPRCDGRRGDGKGAACCFQRVEGTHFPTLRHPEQGRSAVSKDASAESSLRPSTRARWALLRMT